MTPLICGLPVHCRRAIRHPLALSIALLLSAGVHAQEAAPDGTAAAQPATAQPTSTLDAVQVRGVRSSVESAISTKQAHKEISDSIVAEDIGKLPDNSVAAALQRVTGVQVARAGGEVGQVLVRGLPNVITTLDGRNVFTTVGRDMELADVPAELLRSVDVYKTTVRNSRKAASPVWWMCICDGRSISTTTARLPAASAHCAAIRRKRPCPMAASP